MHTMTFSLTTPLNDDLRAYMASLQARFPDVIGTWRPVDGMHLRLKSLFRKRQTIPLGDLVAVQERMSTFRFTATMQHIQGIGVFKKSRIVYAAMANTGFLNSLVHDLKTLVQDIPDIELLDTRFYVPHISLLGWRRDFPPTPAFLAEVHDILTYAPPLQLDRIQLSCTHKDGPRVWRDNSLSQFVWHGRPSRATRAVERRPYEHRT